MGIYTQVNSLPFVTKVYFSFEGALLPSNSDDHQSFFDSLPVNALFYETYFSQSTLRFIETSSSENGNIIYNQSVVFRFNSNDSQRSIRIDQFHMVKYIKLRLDDDRELMIGRNDVEQNSEPTIQVKSDLKSTVFSFKIKSIFPAGFDSLEGNDLDVDLRMRAFPILLPSG